MRRADTVIPDRDMPGRAARPWTSPRTTASPSASSSTVRSPSLPLADLSTKPVMMSMAPTSTVRNTPPKDPSTASSSVWTRAKPTTRDTRVATSRNRTTGSVRH